MIKNQQQSEIDFRFLQDSDKFCRLVYSANKKMGQSCSFVEQKEGHNLYRQGGISMNANQSNNKAEQLQYYKQNQKQSVKQITLIESCQQLIYQFNNHYHTIVKLPIKSWKTQADEIQDIEIEQFLGDRLSFICKIKYYYQSYPVWRVIRVERVESLLGQELKDLGMLYYRFYQIKAISNNTKSFIFADNCFLQINNRLTIKNHPAHSFIIQSQFSLSPFIPLRSLGFFMKFNHICWQDAEFLAIIQKCINLISVSNQLGTFLFQEWLVDTNGEVFSIGTLIEKLDHEGQLLYLQQLTLYLCETLYGHKITVHSLEQLRMMFEQKQKTSNFKHSQSISALLKLYEKGIILNETKQKELKIIEQKNVKVSNIHNYVESYRVKRKTIQSCGELALFYVELEQYEKAKEILYERLSVLMYQLMGQKNSNQNKNKILQLNNLNCHKLRKLHHKSTATKHHSLHELQTIVSYLISLERQVSSPFHPSPQLQHLINQYLHVSLILASHYRSQHNHNKSLSVLLQTRQFLHEEIDFWQLQLHIAVCYFYSGDFQQAETKMEKSLNININEGNVCFMIMFYSSVLNWEKALQCIQEYQYLIEQNFLYDMLVSKIFLSKSLCIAKRSLTNQQQRTSHLYQTITIASKVLDRKSVPQIVLLQAFQIVADGYFYMKHYPTAREFYSKALTICSSIEFTKTKMENTPRSYEPAYMRSASLQYSRSRSIAESKHSISHNHQCNSLQKPIVDQQLHQNSISRTRETVEPRLNNSGTNKQQEQQHTADQLPTSFVYQLNLLFDSNKRAVLLSSLANSYFMEQNFIQAVKFYKEAEQKVSKHNKDMANSIKGNLILCEVQMAKNTNKLSNQGKIQQCRLKLEKMMDETRDQNPSKLENDVNYIFLLNELNSI